MGGREGRERMKPVETGSRALGPCLARSRAQLEVSIPARQVLRMSATQRERTDFQRTAELIHCRSLPTPLARHTFSFLHRLQLLTSDRFYRATLRTNYLVNIARELDENAIEGSLVWTGTVGRYYGPAGLGLEPELDSVDVCSTEHQQHRRGVSSRRT